MQEADAKFLARYLRRVEETKSVLCVGLDPTIDHVPPEMRMGSDIPSIRSYILKVIDIAAEKVPVVKPQYAYYGAMGWQGLVLLNDIVAYAKHKGLLVILDAKRADIGSTMEMYGGEVFDQIGADACTFVPYLGSTFNPSWMPWLKLGRCVISMVRTSNQEAAELQDLVLKNGNCVYEQVAIMTESWANIVAKETGGIGTVGGVIGATWSEQAVRCRELMGDDVFALIPGYGAQGGGAEGAVAGLPASDGTLCGTVNSSRGITFNSWCDKETGEPKPGDPMQLVEQAVDDANQELNAALEAKLGYDPYVEEAEE